MKVGRDYAWWVSIRGLMNGLKKRAANGFQTEILKQSVSIAPKRT